MSGATSQGRIDLRPSVDGGGTFTELVLTDDAGRETAVKTPSTPHSPALAVE